MGGRGGVGMGRCERLHTNGWRLRHSRKNTESLASDGPNVPGQPNFGVSGIHSIWDVSLCLEEAPGARCETPSPAHLTLEAQTQIADHGTRNMT